jgi:hypothetical protein
MSTDDEAMLSEVDQLRLALEEAVHGQAAACDRCEELIRQCNDARDRFREVAARLTVLAVVLNAPL